MTELALLLQAAILGLIQGITEFLPISSSAHLILIPDLLGWSYLGKSFDVALHFGTLLALLVQFTPELKKLTLAGRNLILGKNGHDLEQSRLVKLLIVGCLPAGFLGLIFENFIEETFSDSWVVGCMLIVWGAVLWRADKAVVAGESRSLCRLSFQDALLIGVAQAAALIPGTSRSGSTISAALFLGFSRTEAARFSFLLSLPLVAGASLLKGARLIGEPFDPTLAGALLVGVLVSATSGFFCIKYFMKYLDTHSLTPFALYRVVLGLLILFRV